MNNEMMPLVGLLLLSNDLKKQSDRVIQEVKANNAADAIIKRFEDLQSHFAKAVNDDPTGLLAIQYKAFEKIPALLETIARLEPYIIALDSKLDVTRGTLSEKPKAK